MTACEWAITILAIITVISWGITIYVFADEVWGKKK